MNPRKNPDTGKLSIAYRKWNSMIQRCTNPNHIAYPYYGARGVKVDPLWTERKEGFNRFHQELGDPPKNHWIDRIDNTKGYQPGNCRWVTPSQSAYNRGPQKTNPKSLRQKAVLAGLPYMVVYLRIKTLGWTEEKALSEPKRSRNCRSIVLKQIEIEKGKITNVYPRKTYVNLPKTDPKVTVTTSYRP